MTISISSDSTIPKHLKSNALPRTVSITLAEAHGGRLPVVVTVVPTADTDAGGGVFVDFRVGSTPPDDDQAAGAEPSARMARIHRGDKALDALAAREMTAASEAGPSHGGDDAEAAAAGADAEPTAARRGMVSRQIGKAMKLTVGQAETLRAEVALPQPPSDAAQVWYARGRFATIGGSDLSSAWIRV